MIQFGYVTIFAGVFPLVGALAFVRNLVELRADSFRLCHIYRRPVGVYCIQLYFFFVIESADVLTNPFSFIFSLFWKCMSFLFPCYIKLPIYFLFLFHTQRKKHAMLANFRSSFDFCLYLHWSQTLHCIDGTGQLFNVLVNKTFFSNGLRAYFGHAKWI